MIKIGHVIIKKTIDKLLSFLGIIFLSPILLCVAIVIYFSDGAPAIFKQLRIGKNGTPFLLYKFRTIKNNTDIYGESPTSKNDSNLIRWGYFLRSFSIDELPQLFNILKGDMSLVGPRPLFPSQVRRLNDYHKKRLEIEPGLTGLSQIYHRFDLLSESGLDLEVKYVREYNLLTDFLIILKTLKYVIYRKDIH